GGRRPERQAGAGHPRRRARRQRPDPVIEWTAGRGRERRRRSRPAGRDQGQTPSAACWASAAVVAATVLLAAFGVAVGMRAAPRPAAARKPNETRPREARRVEREG